MNIASNDVDESLYSFDIQGFSGPEIDITGNGISIADGDTTPDPNDATDFGASPVTGGTTSRVFTITNNGPDTLNLGGVTPFVSITGPGAGDFAITVPPSGFIAPSSSTQFELEFNPSTSGLRAATVAIASDDPDENPYTFDISGLGRGVTFWTLTILNPLCPRVGTVTLQTTPTVTMELNTPDPSDYFIRTSDPGTNLATGFGFEFSDIQDSTYWRAEDVGQDGGASRFEDVINWTGIDISGRTDLQFSGYFAAVENGFQYEDEDFIRVEANTGSGFVKLIEFRNDRSNNGGSGNLAVDTDNDGVGDGVVLSQAFSEFGPIDVPGGGTNIDLRISVHVGGAEDIGFDHFTLASAQPAAPEIELSGNGIVINDGDLDPSTSDDTDFGDVALTGASKVSTFTIGNVGNGPLSLTGTPVVEVTGDTSDFVVTASPPSSIPSGGAATFEITFNPTANRTAIRSGDDRQRRC